VIGWDFGVVGEPGKFCKEIWEAVSDRGGGVRSGGEAAREGRRQGEGTVIMKLTTMTQVTLDGVMQGNGSASEDRRNGFERGGWARGAGDQETRTFITQTYQRAEAFLFGRRTYELFAGSWGSTDQMRAHPVGAALNQAPKYVASTTLTAPRWAGTTVLRGNLAAAVGELKARPGGELQVHGSGALTRWRRGRAEWDRERRASKGPRGGGHPGPPRGAGAGSGALTSTPGSKKARQTIS
jgi:dihydrofolate reductase